MKVKRLAAAALALVMILGAGGVTGVIDKPLFAVTASAAAPYAQGSCDTTMYQNTNLRWEINGGTKNRLTITGTGDTLPNYDNNSGYASKYAPYKYQCLNNSENGVEITYIEIKAPLKTIGSYTFNGFTDTTSITLPDTIKNINSYAFVSTKISQIDLKEAKTIGERAFINCKNLKSVYIPRSVTSIGDKAFGYDYDDSLNPVKKSDFVVKGFSGTAAEEYANDNGFKFKAMEKCGDNATWELSDDGVLTIKGMGAMDNYDGYASPPWFEWADEAETLVVENSITSINSNSFTCCKNLKKAYLPSSCTAIALYSLGYDAVWIDGSLDHYEPREGFKIQGYSDTMAESYAKDNGFKFIYADKCGDDLTWTLSDDGRLNITGTGAMFDFEEPEDTPWYPNRKNISSVTIAEDATSIGKNAFYAEAGEDEQGYPILETVTIPWSCTKIADKSLGYYKYSLSGNEHRDALNTIKGYQGSAAKKYAKDNDIAFVSVQKKCGDNLDWELDHDGTLTITGTGDMYDFESITDTPWNDLKSNIKKIVMNNGVTTIGQNAFLGCSNVTDVKIPDTVTKLGNSAFLNCSKLKNITVPKKVTSIGTRAFGYSLTITSFSPFKIEYKKTPDLTVYGYKDSAGEKYAQENEFDFVYICGDYQYKIIDTEGNAEIVKYTGSETDAEIPAELEGAAVISIGESAFMGNMSIKTLTVPEGVVNINKTAFVNCKNLEEITVPKSVSKIGKKAIGYFILFGNEQKTDVTIKGYKDSAAETYAKDNDIKFVPLDKDDSSSKADGSSSSKADDSSSKSDSSASSKADDSSSKPDSSASSKADDSSKPDSKPDNSEAEDQDTTPGEDETIVKGDVNGDGDINVTDIAMVASHVKGIKPLTAKQIKAADVNGDGDINVTDIAMIAAHIKGIKAIPQ